MIRRHLLFLLALLWLASGCRTPVPETAPPLEGTQWVLTGIAGAAFPLSGRAYLQLHDGKEGRISGFAGCNRFSGSLTVSHPSLKIGPLAATRMVCPQMDEEDAFLKALDGIDAYRYDGQTLLLLQDGAVMLRFAPAAMP